MKLSQLFPLSYCVNLAERKDRWDDSLKEFDKIQHYPERFDAVKDSNPITGCRLSHLSILKKANEEKKSVFIFEDDVMFIEDYNAVEICISELAGLNWDMFYLGANICNTMLQVRPHLAQLTHAQATHSYGVHYNFLPFLIEKVETFTTHLDLLYASLVSQYNCFISIPLIAIQRPSYSDIEKQLVNYEWMISRYNNNLTGYRGF